jgi:hypothetical protein
VLGSTGSCGVIWLLESCCLGCMSSVSFLWCWCRSLFGVLSLRVVHGLFSCLIVVWVVAWGLVMGCCVVCVSSSVFVVCAIVVFRFLVSPILVNHFCCCAISFDCCCSF